MEIILLAGTKIVLSSCCVVLEVNIRLLNVVSSKWLCNVNLMDGVMTDNFYGFWKV